MEQINIISKKIENQKLQISNDPRHMDEDLKIMKVIADLQKKSDEYSAYYDHEKIKAAREMEKIKFLSRKIEVERRMITVEEEAKDLQKTNDMSIYQK